MLRVVEVIASTASQSSEAEARNPKPLTPSSPFFPVPHHTKKPAQRMLTERVANSAMIRREKVYCYPSVATSYRQLTGWGLPLTQGHQRWTRRLSITKLRNL